MANYKTGVIITGDASAGVKAVKLTRGELDRLNKTGKSAARQAERTGQAFHKMGALFGAAIGYLSVRSFSSLISAYKYQEQGLASMQAGVVSMGRSTRGLTKDLRALAAHLQQHGVIGDEAIIKGTAFLTTYGKITDELMPRTVRVMADIAAKTGMDLPAAANLLGRASEGMIGSLTRAGISLSDVARQGKNFEVILGEIEEQYGGVNEKLAATATGAFDQLSNSLGDVQESMGQILAIGFQDVARDWAAGFQIADKSAKRMGDTVRGATAEIRANWTLWSDTLSDVGSAISSAILLLSQFTGGVLQFAGVIAEYSGVVGVMTDTWLNALLNMGQNVKALYAIMIGEADQAMIDLRAKVATTGVEIQQLWEALAGAARGIWDSIAITFGRMMDSVLVDFANGLHNIASNLGGIDTDWTRKQARAIADLSEELNRSATAERNAVKAADEHVAKTKETIASLEDRKIAIEATRAAEVSASQDAIAGALAARDAMLAARDAAADYKSAAVDLERATDEWLEHELNAAIRAEKSVEALYASKQDLLKQYQVEFIKLQHTGKERAVQAALLKAHAQGIHDMDQKIRELSGSLYDMKESTKAAAHATAELGEATKAYDAWLERELDAAENAEKAIEDLYDAHQSLVAKYEDEIAATKLSGKELAVHQALIEANTDSTTQFGQQIAVLAGKLYDGEHASASMRDAADPFADSWQEAIKRVDSAFVDLWKSAFQNFSSFKDALKSAFVQLLAELAHAAITQKILIKLGLGGALGGAGTASAATGLLGGGAGLLGGLGNAVSSVFSGAVFSGISTGFGLAMENFGAAGIFGGAMANLSLGVSSLASGAIGTAIGSLATVLGPIAIGVGLLTTLFQDDKATRARLYSASNPDYQNNFEDKYSVPSAFGNLGFYDPSTESLDARKYEDFLKGLAEINDAIAAFLPDSEVQRIKDAMDGFAGPWRDEIPDSLTLAKDYLSELVDKVNGTWKQMVLGFDGPAEEIGNFVVGLFALDDYLENLDDSISQLSSDVDPFTAQLDQLTQAVVDGQQALADAIADNDPAAALTAAQQLQQAIITRYQTETQLVMTLGQSLLRIQQQAAQFHASLLQKLLDVGADIGDPLAQLTGMLDHFRAAGQALLVAFNQLSDPAQRLDVLNQFVQTVDQAVSAARSAVQAWLAQQQQIIQQQQQALQSQQQGIQRQIQAIQEAAKARISALQEELAIAQQWGGILSQVRSQLDQMRFGSANPLPTSARLGLVGGDINTLLAQFQAATGQERIDLAQRLMQLLQTQSQLGQEFFQRPSSEWQSLYNEIVSTLSGVGDEAQSQADRAIEIQDEIRRIQEETAARVAALNDRSQAINDQIQSLNDQYSELQAAANEQLQAIDEEARAYYDWAQVQGDELYAMLQEQTQSQLDELLQGRTLNEFMAEKQQEMVDALNVIRDTIGTFLAGGNLPEGSFAAGTDYVPRDMTARIHRGERIVPAGQNHRGDSGVVVNMPLTVQVHGGGNPRDIERAVESAAKRAVVQMVPVIKRELRRA